MIQKHSKPRFQFEYFTVSMVKKIIHLCFSSFFIFLNAIKNPKFKGRAALVAVLLKISYKAVQKLR